MSEHKLSWGIQFITSSTLTKVPPMHEEPIRGTEVGKIECRICGKSLKTESQLKRHKEEAHGNPDRTTSLDEAHKKLQL